MKDSHDFNSEQDSPLLVCKSASSYDDHDIQPINSLVDFAREFVVESKKLWYLAAPAIFTSFCQYGLFTITQIFAGHLGTIQLAAFSVVNSIIAELPYSMMLGMSSALETYCGQAFGANQYQMLGIYMQKAWVILIMMAFTAIPLFVFTTPVLKFLGQTELVSREAGKLAIWMIPQQFAYAMMFPSTKFLQAQSKVIAIAVIAAVALCLHAFFSWLLIVKLGWGLVGAALVLDGSWWFIAIVQFLYVVAGSCGEAWSGFSYAAFHDLWGFVKTSIASSVMMCLELWYVMAMTLFAGNLEDPETSLDAFSICTNILGWACMVAMGLNVASSVRVSNELGSKHPKKSRFAVVVSGVSSLLIGLFFTFILMVSGKQYPAIFSNSSAVQQLVEQLTPLLGISIVFTNVQYTLLGVVIGAGWQARIAYLSSGCYFLFGVPLGVLLAYYFKMGIKGIWCGMVFGLSLLTCLILWMIWITNWNKEFCKAEERLKQWRVETGAEETGQ